MAKGRLLGIDIGNYRIKYAVVANHVPVQTGVAKIPDNLVKNDAVVSWEAMADFIKESLKEQGIRCKDAAVILPADSAYIRRVTMPLMTVDQLKVNLPYEFHDYITDEADKYVYDYAVIGTGEKEMTLMAAAASRTIVTNCDAMCKRAGLKLQVIAPAECAFRNLIVDYEKRHNIEHGSRDYAILDVGDRTIKLHFFSGGEYEITRSMEPGCHAIAEQVGEITGNDPHNAKISVEEDSGSGAEAQSSQQVTDLYSSIAMQVMRVLNFYSFNYPDNTIDTLYYCGGGSSISGLMKEIEENISIPMVSMTELVQAGPQFGKDVQISPQAVGVAMV